MQAWLSHLPILPIIVPMLCGGLMLLLKEKRRKLNTFISFGSVFIQMAVAFVLLVLSNDLGTIFSAQYLSNKPEVVQQVIVYLLGDWQAPIGIVLVADPLSSLMLSLTAIIGFTSLMFATAYWNRIGVHFYPLFQFILMGLNGAFLTGDLFNLYVFFEIFLAASYGLLLHGSGQRRVGASMHYITVNLISAFLLLIGISMIYAITGTLNMADLAKQAGHLSHADRALFETACSVLGVGFLIKAAAWPLNFWLPNAYSSASAPVAALFAIMTKVGIYALLRIGTLLLPTGAPTAFGGTWMFYIGLATLAFGAIGMLAEKQLGHVVALAIILSSGVLLTALGMPGVALTGPTLFYMVSSVLATSALFLLVELIKRTESYEVNLLAVSMEAFGLDANEDSDYSGEVVGITLPKALAFLGIAFTICAMVVIGLPPLSGFLGKFALLTRALNLDNHAAPSLNTWLMLSFILFSGLASLIAMTRLGIRLFWVPDNLKTPILSLREILSILLLVGGVLVLSIQANPVMEMMNGIALSLREPFHYIDAVMQHRPSGL